MKKLNFLMVCLFVIFLGSGFRAKAQETINNKKNDSVRVKETLTLIRVKETLTLGSLRSIECIHKHVVYTTTTGGNANFSNDSSKASKDSFANFAKASKDSFAKYAKDSKDSFAKYAKDSKDSFAKYAKDSKDSFANFANHLKKK